MKIENYISVLFAVTSILILLAGCSYPHDDKEDPPSKKQFALEISVFYEGSWRLNGDDNADYDLDPYIKEYLNSGVGRHLIRIYKASDVSFNAIPVAILELEKAIEGYSYNYTISLSLPEGNYVAKAWTDFRESSATEPYYNISKFPHIMLDHHSGLTGYQDTFSGTQSFEVDCKTSSIEISMKRPVGKYLLINKDFSKFLDETSFSIDEVYILAYYTGFYPDTYSVITDRLTDSLTGEYYIVQPEFLTDGSAIIATDFMLMNSGGSSAVLQLRMVDKKGETIASSESISIPMNRNEITIIKRNLLKASSGVGGGFDIDTGFDGDFNITP